MDVEIRALTPEEEVARISALEMAARLVGGALPLSVAQVQALYQVLKDEHPDFDEGKIALGVAFGELIVAQAGYYWVRLTDEYGSETSLAHPTAAAECHPISMMQKRVERGEDLDIAGLRDDTIALVDKRFAGGLCAARKNEKPA